MNFNIGCNINLEKLIDTRLLIQANSGGGKSYAIRKLLEETNGKVQQIVLDLEGEFFSLREKFDFIVFGKEGDFPVHIKYADKLARTLLEYSTSAIIDLYELKHHERITFVKRFLESMINAPKNLWHPCIVVVDEAHLFCPEKGSAESMSAVIDLCTRGRKRGYCAVLATQRLSKLHKDAAAECNNKLIGRTGLDVDMKRSGDELGFTNKHDLLLMRELEAGSFFAFGPAISNQVTKIKISEVQTFHPKTGARLSSVPPASEKIKKILSQFKDIPTEAEREIKTEADLRKEISSLRMQLIHAQKQTTNNIDNATVQKLKAELQLAKTEAQQLKKNLMSATQENEKIFEKTIKQTKAIITEALNSMNKIEISGTDSNKNIFVPSVKKPSEKIIKEFVNKSPLPLNDYNEKITGGAMRMLKSAAMYSPNSISKFRMAAISCLSFSSGSFGTYLATLKRNGLLTVQGNDFTITDKGLEIVGDFTPLPSDPDALIEMWAGIVKGGAARMLKVLANHYPQTMSKEELWTASGLSNSGSFGTYLATLKRNGLITQQGQYYKASDELFQ